MAFRDGALTRNFWHKGTTGATQVLAHLEELGDGVWGAARGTMGLWG